MTKEQTTEFKSSFEFIQNEISNHDVVLFMKGSADFPQCGFSQIVATILKKLAINFKDINVLADPILREAIKEFSDWPTIPQLYVKGEFIGGCDIVKELYQTGDLEKLLNSIN